MYKRQGNTLNNPAVDADRTLARQIGVYGDLRLGFREFLYVHVTGRNDWRSVLARENRSFFYPSVDFSFIASDAIPALTNSGVIQALKLRGGWSKVGQVNIDPYALRTTFSQGSNYPYSSGAGFTLDNTLVSSSLRPEMTTGIEGGFDVELRPMNVSAGLTLYKTNTVDQTILVNVSSASGFNSLRTNVGEVENKGLESYLKITPINTSTGLRVNLGMTYTLNRNKVIALSDQSDELVLSTLGSAARVLAKKGSPFPLLQVTRYNRDDQGRIIVDPITGYPATDGTFFDKGVTVPPHVLGLTGEVQWKNFRFSTVFEYRTGHYIFNGITTGYDFSGAGIRTAWFNRDRFVIPNSSYQLPDGSYTANTNIAVRSGGADFWTDGTRNTNIGENYANSAAFWKMREATLSYDLPASILGGTRFIKGCLLYTSPSPRD